MSRRPILGMIAMLLPLIVAGSSVRADPVTVLSTANIFSAGNNAANLGAWINPGDTSWGTAAPYIDLGGTGIGRALTFSSITGAVDYGGGMGFNGPDGFSSASSSPWSAWGSISGIVMNQGAALLGVFTTDAAPTGGAPAALNFVGNTGFDTLSPLLNQLFFVGDGRTGTGTGQLQRFFIPDSATRLYLGFADRSTASSSPGAYQDNKGSLTADFSIGVVPEPSSALVALAGAAAATVFLRRRSRPRPGVDPA